MRPEAEDRGQGSTRDQSVGTDHAAEEGLRTGCARLVERGIREVAAAGEPQVLLAGQRGRDVVLGDFGLLCGCRYLIVGCVVRKIDDPPGERMVPGLGLRVEDRILEKGSDTVVVEIVLGAHVGRVVRPVD